MRYILILFIIGSLFQYTQHCYSMKRDHKMEKMVASFKETKQLLGNSRKLTLETSRRLTIKTKTSNEASHHTTDKNTKKDDSWTDQGMAVSFREISEIETILKHTIDETVDKINPENDIGEIYERTKDANFSTKFKKRAMRERDQKKKNAKLFCLLSLLCPCAAPCFLPAACYYWHKLR